VEHQLDRFPHHKDDNNVVNEWTKIRTKYNLIDGWREQNETEKEFTFTQPGTMSMSRIDRIYLNRDIYPYAYKWSINTSAKISGHNIASVEILKKQLPYIGQGT